jgi:hypothetical protein
MLNIDLARDANMQSMRGYGVHMGRFYSW